MKRKQQGLLVTTTSISKGKQTVSSSSSSSSSRTTRKKKNSQNRRNNAGLEQIISKVHHRDKGDDTLLVQFLIKSITLVVVFTMAFAIRSIKAVRFEPVLDGYDAYFNHKVALRMTEKGIVDTIENWHDDKVWYPYGRHIGRTILPGLPTSVAIVKGFLNFFSVPISLQQLCIFFPPFMGSLSCLVGLLFTRQVLEASSLSHVSKKGSAPISINHNNIEGSALLAAALLAITPGTMAWSSSGNFENECLGIPLMLSVFTSWLWALRNRTIYHAIFAGIMGLALAATWDGFSFAINALAVHTICLLFQDKTTLMEEIMSNKTTRSHHVGLVPKHVYQTYCIFFFIACGLAPIIPYYQIEGNMWTWFFSIDLLMPLGVFLFLQCCAIVQVAALWLSNKSDSPKIGNSNSFNSNDACQTVPRHAARRTWKNWIFLGCLVAALLAYLTNGAFSYGRHTWLLGFLSKFKNDPIAASVGDIKPTAWAALFMDLHMLLLVFPAGVSVLLHRPTEGTIFLLTCSCMALFIGSAVSRFAPLILTPIACVVGAIAISDFLHVNLKIFSVSRSDSGAHTRGGRTAFSANAKELAKFQSEIALVLVTACAFLLVFFVFHCTWVAGSIATPSIFLTATEADGTVTIYDDYRQAYAWLKENTIEDARVLSWWDYGYHINALANRTTFVDNYIGNQTHLAKVGAILCSPEHDVYPQLREMRVDYVLVVFGGAVNYRSDDINKLLWMLRVTESTLPESGVVEDAFLTHRDVPVNKMGQRNSKGGELDDDLIGGALKVGSQAPEYLFESVLYKLSYYRFGKARTVSGKPRGWDTVRQAEIGRKHFDLQHFEEVYTSPRWLVRIYKVKDPNNLVEYS